MTRECHVRFCESAGVRSPRATHLVVFCESEADAHAAKSEISAWLAVRGLRLSEAKTRIVHLTQGFDFLGFNIRH